MRVSLDPGLKERGAADTRGALQPHAEDDNDRSADVVKVIRTRFQGHKERGPNGEDKDEPWFPTEGVTLAWR